MIDIELLVFFNRESSIGWKVGDGVLGFFFERLYGDFWRMEGIIVEMRICVLGRYGNGYYSRINIGEIL